jgi:hypothetical protein
LEAREREIIEKPRNYAIDAEIGRLGIDTFEIKKGRRSVCTTEKDVFPKTGSREHYKTACFREVVVFFPCDETFRRSADRINRLLWRQEKTKQLQVRTMANLVEREGKLIQEQICKKAEGILTSSGFNTEGKLTSGEKAFEPAACKALFPPETVCKMIAELNEENTKERHMNFSELHETFEDPHAVKANISLDDVCCTKQKAEGRKKGSPAKEKREMVYNTVAHIQNGASKTYTLNTSNIAQMMIIVLAFLCHNELLSIPGPLGFFTDGARDLRSAIQNMFSFLSFKIILDWYHLEKKCKDLLSMAINGKQVKQQILSELLAWLWLGKIDRAMEILRNLKEDTIKNKKELENLINYFDRNRSYIPCYALRKKLGLRVSSNPVEKANDIVVSNRQKHNGMSWSADGSTSLATLTAVRRNSEHMNWLLNHDISFLFDAGAKKSAA